MPAPVFVMDDGPVAETGSHAELLARGGRYADMWNAFEGEEPVAVA